MLLAVVFQTWGKFIRNRLPYVLSCCDSQMIMVDMCSVEGTGRRKGMRVVESDACQHLLL